MTIDTRAMDFAELGRQIRGSEERVITLTGVSGQRYIGDGTRGRDIEIIGTPGNALGAYLNGSIITVRGNAQDATGDTMNEGIIAIHGNSGDATGYAMRGGRIYIKGNAGYRAGIHMKAYKDHKPVIVIGGKAGNFLGEYQAGGLIIVLGLGASGVPVGAFCGTGMHGGKIFVRTPVLPPDLPSQVSASPAGEEDLREIAPYLDEFCTLFGVQENELSGCGFYVLTPNTKNPYKQLYTYN